MDNLLASLKIDLGIVGTTAYDTRLKQYLAAAIKAIRREGALTINTDDPEDAQIIIMYAAWTWRKRDSMYAASTSRRRDSMEGMPRMLRWQLNNRIMSEKAGAADD